MKNNINADISPRNDVATPQPKKWKRHFERGIPKDALTWSTARQRAARMFGWQCAVTTNFASSARVVRIAWLLSLLCQKEGYAFPTDDYISKTLGIPLNKVQQALTELERAGAIVRASSFVDGKPQRRIWPSIKIIPPKAGGMDTPRDHRGHTPHGGGTDSIETPRTHKSGRISTTAEAAKRDAERRERRRETASSGHDVRDERRAPEAPRRLAPPCEVVLEGEITLDDCDDDSGVAVAPPPDHLARGVDHESKQARWEGKVIDQDGNDFTPPSPERRSPPGRKSNMQRGREMFGGIQ
jgi:hypothetical protein